MYNINLVSSVRTLNTNLSFWRHHAPPPINALVLKAGPQLALLFHILTIYTSLAILF